MTPEQLRKSFGPDYPAAILYKGKSIPLTHETRFHRVYRSLVDGDTTVTYHSRFMDESASISLAQIQTEWPAWSADERLDFCNASHWLHQHPEFPDMLRFIMQHSGPSDWSTLALGVAYCLPKEEAFDTLLRALNSREIGKTSNLTQAIAHTEHPQAESVLRQHLELIWAHPEMWRDDEFLNWVAQDAKNCIEHLLELGAPPADFENYVRRLSQHPCVGNRESCRNFLGKYYSWLS